MPTSFEEIPGLSAPAKRALHGAGLSTVEQLTTVAKRTVAELHGMGPKGVRLLEAALSERGLAFADQAD